MEIPIGGGNYEEVKRKAEIFYKSIGCVWCPALNDSVSFDKIGFAHLVRKGRRCRAKSEQKRRLALLPYVEDILGTRQFSFKEERIIRKDRICYWKFVSYQNGDIIKIIVRQIEGGHKHFLSIYGKIKNLRQKA